MADNARHQKTNDQNDNSEPKRDVDEPTDKDLFPLQRHHVRRRLDFFDEDLTNIPNNLLFPFSEEIHKHRQKAREKWNFDFENEIPLDGDWQWEKIPVVPVENTKVVSTMEKESPGNRSV